MKTFCNIAMCALATIIASPVAAFLINLIIDLAVWLEYFASSISFISVIQKPYNDIGWVIISAVITKFLVPFAGAYQVLEFGGGTKYTWPPAVSFFLFSMFCAVHNAYFYIHVFSGK